jgi:peptidoglycan/xylan/chitin deacetylase (PgdA/CDA1 family)
MFCPPNFYVSVKHRLLFSTSLVKVIHTTYYESEINVVKYTMMNFHPTTGEMTPMKMIHVIILLAVVLVTTNCSQVTPINPPTTKEPEQGQQQDTDEKIPETTPEENVPVPVEPDITKPDPSMDNKPNEPIEQNYHMTSNFYVKPNDENTNKNVVLLTFDDGPKDETMLTALLDILDKHNAKAIFFVNGYRIKQKPELLKLIHERGQAIGNHSWDHINLRKETPEKVEKQINDVQVIVNELIGVTPLYFRPPHGAGNDYIRAKAKEEGMLYMTWSNGSLDWADNIKNPQGVIDTVMEQLMPGSNILMHEVAWTVEALDELLTRIKEQGYSFLDPSAIQLESRS